MRMPIYAAKLSVGDFNTRSKQATGSHECICGQRISENKRLCFDCNEIEKFVLANPKAVSALVAERAEQAA